MPSEDFQLRQGLVGPQRLTIPPILQALLVMLDGTHIVALQHTSPHIKAPKRHPKGLQKASPCSKPHWLPLCRHFSAVAALSTCFRLRSFMSASMARNSGLSRGTMGSPSSSESVSGSQYSQASASNLNNIKYCTILYHIRVILRISYHVISYHSVLHYRQPDLYKRIHLFID